MTNHDSSSDPTSAPADQNIEQTLQQALKMAIGHHEAGRLDEAQALYQAILQLQPRHPEASHNLALIVMAAGDIDLGLSLFDAALQAMPGQAQYWLSYIDALIQARQLQLAREVLQLGRQHGLGGDEVEQLASRLQAADSAAGADRPAVASQTPPPQARTEAAKPPAGRNTPGSQPPASELNTLKALYQQGKLDLAVTLARDLSVRFPAHVQAWKVLGDIYYRQGQLDHAAECMQQVASLLPRDPEAYSNLGAILQALGRLEQAEASLRQALRLKPSYAEAHSNLGIVLQAQGRLEEAEASLRRASALKPQLAGTHYNLGITLKAQGKAEAAEESLRRAIGLDPGYAEAYNNLGVLFQEQGRLGESERILRKAVQLNPGIAEVHNNLGITLQHQGKLAEAEASLRQALEINPYYADAHNNLGATLKDQGRLADAEASLRAALSLNPDFAGGYNNLALVLKAQGRFADAQSCLTHALTIAPDFAEAHNTLGYLLQEQGHLLDAEACMRRALALKPGYAEGYSNLGVVLQGQSRLQEAVSSLRQALAINPAYADAHSNLLFCLSEIGSVGADELFAEHLRFGQQFEAPLRPAWPAHANDRDPARRLQVGFVSGDLRNHAVAVFVEPVLACLAQRSGLCLHAYYNHTAQDGFTARMKTYFAHWNAVAGMSDTAVAEKIRADGIDILIDLSGHTAYNRMLTFARKPAPVQASWIGYPGSTGLQAMDYLLTERGLLPPVHDIPRRFTEQPACLPASAPFLPASNSPDVNPLPALTNGYLTFGSFNRISKVSRDVVGLWSRLLRALPDSRMILGGMPETGGQDVLAGWFAEEGIDQGRLSFYPRTDMACYLALHHQVDICLDTFPYSGGTTTFNALWMGVPTLNLIGPSFAGRVSLCVLGYVGLQHLAVEDADDFVANGLALASGGYAQLAALRGQLRQRFLDSHVARPDGVADTLELALRTMWSRWCAGLPAQAFEVTAAGVRPLGG